MNTDRTVSRRSIVSCRFCGKDGFAWAHGADRKAFLATVYYEKGKAFIDESIRHGKDECPELQKRIEEQRLSRKAKFMVDRGKWRERDCNDCHEMIAFTNSAKLMFALEVKVKIDGESLIVIHISNGADQGEKHFTYCGQDITDEQIVAVGRISESKTGKGDGHGEG